MLLIMLYYVIVFIYVCVCVMCCVRLCVWDCVHVHAVYRHHPSLSALCQLPCLAIEGAFDPCS